MKELSGEQVDHVPGCLAWSLEHELSGIAAECGPEHPKGARAQNGPFRWSQRREGKIRAWMFP